MLKKIKEGLKYQKLTEEEKKSRHILGRLVGTCADFINPTRNGRGYSETLWENVFNSDLMKEKIANRVCYGELGHPEDRTEIDMEKVAVCLAEQPVKNSKGQLEAVFDILDTPNGRILKTLCEYGSTLGISSRGQGDLVTDINGNESVDPDTYECECWDVVLIPAVKEARLKYVTESFDPKSFKLKKALKEAYRKEPTEEGKKIMAETLQKININLNESIAKEIKLNDCKKLETYEDASAVCKKLHADKWAFGISDEGFSNGKSIFDAYIKDGNSLYVYEDGENSFAFLLSPSNEIKLCCDLDNRNIVTPNILTSLKSEEDKKVEEEQIKNDEVSETEGDEQFKMEEALEKNKKDSETLPLDINLDNSKKEEENKAKLNDSSEDSLPMDKEDLPMEDDEESISEPKDNETEAKETEDSESDKEVFINYLVDNFEPDQILKACKALNIDLPSLTEKEESEEIEKSTEMDSMEDETSLEDKSSMEKEPEEEVKDLDEAVNSGSAKILTNLKEALKAKSDLEMLVKNLQEKTAVSDSKVNDLTEKCNGYKKSITRLATIIKSRKKNEENSSLKESLLRKALNEKDDTIKAQKLRIERLTEARNRRLKEGFEKSNSDLNSLKESYETKIKTLSTENEIKVKAAVSEITTLKESLDKTQTLKESYKNLANRTMNLLIEEKAKTLGLTSSDIKRKLGSSYTIEDVQKVCEDLKSYQLNVSRLPFSVDKHYGIKVNESVSKDSVKSAQKNIYDDDDYVSDSLIRLANNGRW